MPPTWASAKVMLLLEKPKVDEQPYEPCTDCADGDGNKLCVECGGDGYKISEDGITRDFCLPCDGSGDCRVCKGTGERPPTY